MKVAKLRIKAAAAVLAIAASVGLAPAQAQEEKDWVKAGTVEIDSTQMAFIISGKAGGGVLHFQGKEYPFNIGGLGIGSIGVQTIKATGTVYNMKDVSQFPGVFVQASADATLGKASKGATRLSNDNGVILDLKTSGEGVAVTVGVEGMSISLKK